MTRKQPADLAASIRQRLLNLSREKGEDFNLTLTRYAGERLLYRLSRSKYADLFILKGATLFSVWTDKPYRPTRDLDFLGYGDPTEGELKLVFADICKVKVEPDGIVFDADSMDIAEIREAHAYQGQRLRIRARLGKAGVVVQADICFGDVVTPKAEEIEFPTLLDLPAPRVRAYPRESVIAEKLQAMIHLGMPNSRMKDYYDIYVIARSFDFDGSTLVRAIIATFKRRETSVPSGIPIALSDEFARDNDKNKQWEAFLSRGGLEEDTGELANVIDFLRKFLRPPMAAASKHDEFKKGWIKGGPWQ